MDAELVRKTFKIYNFTFTRECKPKTYENDKFSFFA